MHGIAMASIAVGKNVGVAPNEDLYYIADSRGGKYWKNDRFHLCRGGYLKCCRVKSITKK